MFPTQKHSIIIPNFGREDNLRLCLDSLLRSAKKCELSTSQWEVIVAGHTESGYLCSNEVPVRIVECETTPPLLLREGEPRPYWKTRALNAGIDASTGDVLTFLDADAIVGPKFMAGVSNLADISLISPTRLCYRVRYITDTNVCQQDFDKYNAKREDGRDCFFKSRDMCNDTFFGNSQFSIRRDVLGNLRWDESYYGRGFEDWAMIRSIIKKYGTSYRDVTIENGDGAMFHIKHAYSEGFGNDRWADRNFRRFHRKRCLWVTCDNKQSLEVFKQFLCGDWVRYCPDVIIKYRTISDWDAQEANDETDSFLHIQNQCLSIHTAKGE